MRKLTAFVHVIVRDDDGNEVQSGQFGPDDDLPSWAREAITNPDVWGEPEVAAVPVAAEPAKEPPRGGPGSSASAWTAFAQEQGMDVPEGASAKDVQSLWDERKV